MTIYQQNHQERVSETFYYDGKKTWIALALYDTGTAAVTTFSDTCIHSMSYKEGNKGHRSTESTKG